MYLNVQALFWNSLKTGIFLQYLTAIDILYSTYLIYMWKEMDHYRDLKCSTKKERKRNKTQLWNYECFKPSTHGFINFQKSTVIRSENENERHSINLHRDSPQIFNKKKKKKRNYKNHLHTRFYQFSKKHEDEQRSHSHRDFKYSVKRKENETKRNYKITKNRTICTRSYQFSKKHDNP